MKLLGISGSARNKNTNFMLKTVLDATGANFEIIDLKDCKINPCLNCRFCHKTFECTQKDDMKKLYLKLIETDVVVFASPTYFDNVSGIMKHFMDRCLPFYFSRKLENKKAVVLSVGGFKNLVKLDKNGNCVWCKTDNACKKTVRRCINSLKFFANQLGMKVIAEEYAIHGDSTRIENKLVKIGKSLIE